MDWEILEKILNLFDNCQSHGKSLQINIDDDLLKILPLPRKLILDLLSDQSIPIFFRLSNDQNTLYFQNNLRLCPIDENESGSCHSSSCNQLHICKNYLFNNNCSKLKCSHSLSTNHNENILKNFNISLNDEYAFKFISRLIKLSLINSSKLIVQIINGENLSDYLIDQLLNEHKSLLKDQKLINSNTIEFIFDDDEVASMMENFLVQHHSKIVLVRKNFSEDLIEKDLEKVNHSIEHSNLGRGRGRLLVNNNQNTFSRRLASNSTDNEKKFTFSQRLNSIKNENSSSKIKTKSPELPNNHTDSLPKTISPTFNDTKESISPQNTNFKPHFVLRGHSTKAKDKNPNQTLINYIYNKPFIDEHLCYLLGPGKEKIIEKDQCQILSCLPSNYCRVKTNEQGKHIENELYSILPETLNIELIKIPNDLSLLICSSAAEEIFQQSQMDYAIISESSKIPLTIEVIHTSSVQQKRSPSISRENSSSDGKFHIKTTDSSIDVICGDICQTPVDMMICISTSNSLRDNVLRRAGAKIESQYKERHRSNDALLLDGGLSAAKKILFVPWQTEIEQTEITKIQKSLSDLVKWCIEQAYERKAKSISFPPIGTGQLGLDPMHVCEAMISAASECLHKYTIDVIFVIYSSNGFNEEDECYQVFRIYLDSLCQQIKSNKISTPTISKNFEMKKESIRRNVQSKRILALSDSSNVIKDYNSLIKSLEDLMYEKTFDLSLVESSIFDQTDLLIDICLKSNVYPRIDYSREEITVHGDRDSCLQCFFNLRQDKKIHQYSYAFIENGEKFDEKIFNSFISLKIDQAFAVGESNICVKDNDQIIFNIDLNKLQVRFNKDKQSTFLVKKQLNVDGKIEIPLTWSSSLLMIRTVEINKSLYKSLECFRAFQESMSISDWEIERIDSIENFPLYIHFMNNNKNEKTKFYYHGCSYSSVQSIIHYGLHSTNASNYGLFLGDQYDQSTICLTSDILNSHLYGSRRSTDGKHYIFAVEIAKNDFNNDLILLSNEQICSTLPTYLIVYQRRKSLH